METKALTNRQLDIRKIYHGLVFVVVALFILGLVYLQLRPQDYYATEESVVEALTDQYASNGDRILAQSHVSRYFYPGTYQLRIYKEAADADAHIQVYDKWGNYILAEQAYESGATEQILTFTTESNHEDVFVRFLTSDPSLDADDLQIIGYQMKSDAPVCQDAKWSVLLLALLGGILYVGYSCATRCGRPAFLVLTLTAVIAALPFYSTGLQGGHDMPYHLMRIVNIGRAMAGGYYPTGINSLMIGGTIFPIMYPELLLAGAGFMVATGATVILAFKVLCTCITLATAYIAYYSARQIVDERTSMLFAILWVINPYRMNNLFARADVGEALACIFLPLVAIGMWQVLCDNARKGTIHLVLGYSGLLASHMLTTVIVGVFCAFFVVGVLVAHPLRFVREIRRMGILLLAAVGTVLMNAYYLVPFLTYYGWDLWMTFGESSYERVVENSSPLWQLFMGAAATGGENVPGATLQGEMPLSVGTALLFAGLGWIVYQAHMRRGTDAEPASRRIDGAVWFCLLLGALAAFMASIYFPWEYLFSNVSLVKDTLGHLQFSWRLMMIPGVLLSFLMAVLVVRLLARPSAVRQMIAGGLCIIALIGAIDTATSYYAENGMSAEDHYDVPNIAGWEYILTNVYANHYGEVYQWLGTEGRGPESLDDNENLVVSDYHRIGVEYEFVVSNTGDTDAVITVPVFWYGLHQAVMTDETGQTTLTMTMNEDYQLSDVTIPAGTTNATVRLVYTEPSYWKIGYIVSGVTLVAFIVALCAGHRRNR